MDTQNKKVIEYLKIYDQVVEHLFPMFKDHTLPPGVIDVNARMRAQDEALMLHRGNNLVRYYERLKVGAV